MNVAGLSLSSNVISALNSTSNITTTANVAANFYTGNGYFLSGIVTSVANINNGTSNVSIDLPNANVTVGVNGTSNVAVFAATGEYITGILSVSGNITGANVNGNGSGLSSLTGGNVTGQVSNALVAGTVYTAAQPNITSVGTLTSLSSSGNIDGANINGNGSGLSSITGANVTGQVGNALIAGTVYTSAQPNITSVGTLTSLSSTGNIDGANINGIGSGLSSITGANVTGQVGNALVAGTVYTAAQPNITSVGILTSLSSSGNIVGSNLITSGVVSASSMSASGNVTGGNLITASAVSAASVSASGNITGGNVLYGAGQVSGTGNIYANNVAATAQISATGNLISNLGLYVGAGATATSLTNPIIVAQASGLAYVQVAAKNTAATGSADFVAYANNGTETAAWTDMGMTGSGFNDTAYTITGANDGYVFVQGNTDGTGGLLTLATGENGTNPDIVFATGGFLSTNEKMRFVHATGQFDIETTTAAANTTTGALRVRGGAGVAGNIYAGGLVSVTGNILTTSNVSGGNVLTGGIVSATGNITGGNVNAVVVSATGDVQGGNLRTGGLVSATGNVTGGNIITSAAVSAGSMSASGNITGGNVNTNTVSGTGTIIKSTGDINLSTTGNVVVNSTYINGVTNPVQNQDVATKIYVDNAVSTSISYHQPVAAATNTTLATATGGTISYTQPNGAGNGVGALLTTTGSFDLIDTANVQTVGTRILVKNEANAVYNGVYTWANATNIVRSTDADTYGAGNISALGINDYFFTTGGNVNAGSAFVVSAPTGTITFGTSNIVFSTFSTSQTYTANTAAGVSLAGTVINAKVDGTTTAFDGGGNIIVKASAALTTPNIGAATGTSVSVTANITGCNINTGGMVSATGNISGSYILGNGSQLVGLPAGYSNANVAAYLPTYTGSLPNLTGVVTTTANITGGNINTGGIVSATGNITSIANVSGGNVLSSALIQGVTLSASGNVNGGNLTTAGTVSATGNITSSGNISGGNILGGANVNATLFTGTTVSVTGNITGGNLNAAGLSLSSNVVSALNVTGSIAGGNITTPGTISATGNINGANIIITGALIDSTGNLDLQSTAVNGNVNITPAGTGIVGIPTSLSVTGNITGGNVLGGANVNATTHTGTTVSVTGNITGGNLSGTNIVGTLTTAAQTNITSLGTLTSVTLSGTIKRSITTGGYLDGNYNTVEGAGTTPGAIYTIGGASYQPTANALGTMYGIGYGYSGGTANVGGSSGVPINQWGMYAASAGVSRIFLGSDTGNIYASRFVGLATSAQYADVAEKYLADADYPPGTVLIFGGEQEVTAQLQSHSTAIAGVVSENPSHLMNAGLEGEHVAAVALLGRVPCQVQGTIRKGDLLVASNTAGVAQRLDPTQYLPGCVIGKALDNYDSAEVGTIEIAVGVK